MLTFLLFYDMQYLYKQFVYMDLFFTNQYNEGFLHFWFYYKNNFDNLYNYYTKISYPLIK